MEPPVEPAVETVPHSATDTGVAEALSSDEPAENGALVEDELLVEEISIDGMCGVY